MEKKSRQGTRLIIRDKKRNPRQWRIDKDREMKQVRKWRRGENWLEERYQRINHDTFCFSLRCMDSTYGGGRGGKTKHLLMAYEVRSINIKPLHKPPSISVLSFPSFSRQIPPAIIFFPFDRRSNHFGVSISSF